MQNIFNNLFACLDNRVLRVFFIVKLRESNKNIYVH